MILSVILSVTLIVPVILSVTLIVPVLVTLIGLVPVIATVIVLVMVAGRSVAAQYETRNGRGGPRWAAVGSARGTVEQGAEFVAQRRCGQYVEPAERARRVEARVDFAQAAVRDA